MNCLTSISAALIPKTILLQAFFFTFLRKLLKIKKYAQFPLFFKKDSNSSKMVKPRKSSF